MFFSIYAFLFSFMSATGPSEPLKANLIDFDEYVLVKNAEGIKVFNKINPKKGFVEYKAQVEIKEEEVQNILDFFKDYGNHPNWVYNCTSSAMYTIKGESYLYQICSSPWPYRDRDVNLLATTEWVDKNKAIVRFESRPKMAAQIDKLVRIEKFISIWTVEKNQKSITVTVETSFNPKLGAGNLFLKSYSVKIPFETLKNFKKVYSSKK